MNPTVHALVQRGFDSRLAESLRRTGYTVKSLGKLSSGKLSELGVSPSCQEALVGKRPLIPEDIINSLLYSSAHTCCVCRDSTRGVVIHHITLWSKSHSHAEKNLVVLCPLCHDKAHTKKELARELTTRQLRHHKQVWEAKVRRTETESLFTNRLAPITNGYWDYFNCRRLLDCAASLSIDARSLPGCADLSSKDSRALDWPYRWAGMADCGPESGYGFFGTLLRTICDRQKWFDLRSIWTRTQLRSLLRANTLIVLTANHHFKSAKGTKCGPGQARTGHYTRRGIRLEFTFDAWECTSSSSYFHHLRGSWLCTSLSLVRSVTDSVGQLIVHATCLAIGTGFTEYESDIPDVAYTHGNLGKEMDDER